MKRRNFLAALAALPFAGKLTELLEPAFPHRTVTGRVTFTNLTLPETYRKVQAKMRLASTYQFEEWELLDPVDPADFEWTARADRRRREIYLEGKRNA